MKNNLFKLRIVASSAMAAVMVLYAGRAGATGNLYISGSITFDAAATLNNPIGSATEFTGIFGMGANPDPIVLSTTGNYAAVPANTAAVFTPFTFNPVPVSSFTLWTFTVDSTVYSFLATAVTYVSQYGSPYGSFLNIAGTGVAHIDGFSDTPGTWSITDTGAGQSPVFTFGAGTTVVPEPSTMALLLGLAPMSWFVVSRARARSRSSFGR